MGKKGAAKGVNSERDLLGGRTLDAVADKRSVRKGHRGKRKKGNSLN